MHLCCRIIRAIEKSSIQIFYSTFVYSLPKFNNLSSSLIGNNGTCGHAVGLPASISDDKLNVMSVHGAKFRNKPTDACTVALWVKLQDDHGIHKLFYTTGIYSRTIDFVFYIFKPIFHYIVKRQEI